MAKRFLTNEDKEGFVLCSEQSLTEEQKAQARFNIGAIGQFENTTEVKNASLTDSANGSVSALKLYVKATQGGTGTASPTNVRPFTGVDNVTVTIANGDETSGSTDMVTFPQTCYGGYVDWTAGKLVVEYGICTPLLEKIGFNANSGADYQAYFQQKDLSATDNGVQYYGLCNRLHCYNVAKGETRTNIFSYHSGGIVRFRVEGVTDLESLKAWVADNPLEFWYKLAEPIVYDLEPLPELHSFYPITKVSTDGEKAVITYVADTKNYIDKKFNELAIAMIANG